MAWPTLGEIVQEGIKDAGLVAGTSVQQYTEPQLVLGVNRIFDILMRKEKWDHLWVWDTFTLNGTTGLTTVDWGGIRDYTDVAEIRISGEDTQIHRAPRDSRRFIAQASGNALYWEPLVWNHASVEKIAKFWPLTSTTVIDVYALHRPDTFVEDGDTVPFDKLVTSLGALWYLLKADGINPAAAETAQGLFDIAYQDLLSSRGQRDFGHRYRRSNVVIPV